ncbi:MAG: zinc-dependent alcohol dehydrogenase family protein [Actinomycetales bacterium]|nr:zinc-dependent alcohol dehydrogenase family protein [Actinomycetales bacterium]
MRAVYFEKFNGPIEIRDIEVPYPAPNSVLIKVEATGLCRSDWHGYVGHDSDISLPHVPGHELAGTVAQVGNQVKNFKVGDRVTVPFVNGCGKCEWCISGNAQVCPTQSQPGFTQFGSFAEYVEIKNADFNLIHLPESISFEVAAALGCRFATAFRGLTAKAKVKSGDLVAVFGCGGVGLSAIMIAKAFGAKVVAVDLNETALNNANEIGADFAIHASEAISKIQSMGGAHISVDALGSQQTAEASVKSLRRLGKHIQLGLLLTEDGLTPMAMARVIGWELELIGSHGMAAVDYPEMLKMIVDGKLNPELFIKKKISLEEAPQALSQMNNSIQDGITIIKP